jgi:hypothetical protein
MVIACCSMGEMKLHTRLHWKNLKVIHLEDLGVYETVGSIGFTWVWIEISSMFWMIVNLQVPQNTGFYLLGEQLGFSRWNILHEIERIALWNCMINNLCHIWRRWNIWMDTSEIWQANQWTVVLVQAVSEWENVCGGSVIAWGQGDTSVDT